MTYIIRNTIVLGAVLFLLLGVGSYFTLISLPGKISAIDAEISQIQNTLQNTPDLANEYNVVAKKLADMRERWDARSKDIPPRDITGETYGYLNQILGSSGEVQINLNYNGPPKSFGKYGYNEYTLDGFALYDNLFKFIWYLENGRRFLKIPEIKLEGLPRNDSLGYVVYVKYSMRLWAFYSPVPELNLSPAHKSVLPTVLTSNPFFPLIREDLPLMKRDEIDIERSELKAVIQGKAFIFDQNRKQRVIEENDPVYLGYVLRILPEQGRVECLLNKGGVSERYELAIRVGQPIQ